MNEIKHPAPTLPLEWALFIDDDGTGTPWVYRKVSLRMGFPETAGKPIGSQVEYECGISGEKFRAPHGCLVPILVYEPYEPGTPKTPEEYLEEIGGPRAVPIHSRIAAQGQAGILSALRAKSQREEEAAAQALLTVAFTRNLLGAVEGGLSDDTAPSARYPVIIGGGGGAQA